MIADGGVAAVGEGAGAPVADAHHVVGVPAEDARFDPARTAAVASSTEKGNKKQISRRTQDAAMKLQWPWRMQCHTTSSLIFDDGGADAGDGILC